LGEERRLNAVKEALEPADQLGLAMRSSDSLGTSAPKGAPYGEFAAKSGESAPESSVIEI